MKCAVRLLASAGVLALSFPRVAAATTAVPQHVSPLRIGADAAAMAVAVLLLIDVLALRRVADGSMVGSNLALVLVAAVCLSASVLAGWAQLFLPSVDAEQVALIRDLLVLAGMGALAAYFFGIFRAMRSFVRGYGTAGAVPEQTAPPEGGASEDG